MSNRIADILVTELDGSKTMVDAFSIAAAQPLRNKEGTRVTLKDVSVSTGGGFAVVEGYAINVKETPEEILALKKQAFEDCLNMGG